jgi:uncharacterized oxidoreductase
MRLSGNTILITGGTSGIGLELATRFATLENTVIVTGRSQAKLDAVSTKLPGVHAIQSDVSDPTAITALYEYVTGRFPDLNMLINNAGIMRKINLHGFGSSLLDLTREVEINLDGPIRMTVQFLPQLKAQKAAAIVNVSSGLASRAVGDFTGLLCHKGGHPLVHAVVTAAIKANKCHRI